MEQQSKRVSACGLVFSLPLLVSQFSLAGIEEIIVTAQKREQNLQDVPIAVSALSGTQLNNLSISDVFDLQDSVPALAVRQNQTATTSNFSIRGVGTSGSNFGLESSVGLYVDGVYRARQNSMINEMVDMAGVEVLRGPQGTLFGRNTSSGAVLMNTAAPSQEFGGYVSASAGNLGLISTQGAVGGGLVDDVLAWRLAGFTTDRDGYVSDRLLGSDSINDRDREGGRLQFLYTPSDDIRIRLIGDYSRIDETCCSAVTVNNNYQVYTRDSLTGSYATFPGFGSDSILSLPSSVLIPGTPIPGFGVALIGEDQVFDDLVSLSSLPESTNRDKGFSIQADWDLSSGTLTSISGWREFESNDYVDGDFSSIDIFSRRERADQEAFTQEFRFHFSGDRVEGIVGAYYFQQTLDSLSDTQLGVDTNNYVALGVYSQASSLAGQAALAAQGDDLGSAVALQNAAFSAAELGTAMVLGLENVPLDPASTLYPLQLAGFSGQAFPATASGLNRMSQDHKAWALFGQFDYRFTDTVIVTAGLRYTSEEKEIEGTFSEPGASWGALLGLPDLTIINPRENIDETLNDEQITGTLKLSWYPLEDLLFFASFGTGYKSGGTNTDRINPAFSVIFDAETSETFELGMKADIPAHNLRLNVTLHHTTTEDYQTNAFQGNGFNLSNAGKVEARGGELELWWSPTATFSGNFAYVYNKAEFKGFDKANCWIAYSWLTGVHDPGRGAPTDQFCDRSGGALDTNPEHSFIVGGSKIFPLGQGRELYVRGDYVYRGEQYMDSNLDPYKIQDGYGVFNARTGVRLLSQGIDIALWGRNLSDEDYLNVHFDVPLQFGKLNAYTAEPRTYGATLRVEF